MGTTCAIPTIPETYAQTFLGPFAAVAGLRQLLCETCRALYTNLVRVCAMFMCMFTVHVYVYVCTDCVCVCVPSSTYVYVCAHVSSKQTSKNFLAGLCAWHTAV
jgi:hypothetical protein